MESTLYLLTGAAGFLGSNISRELVTQGKKVRALVLEGDPAVKMVPPEVDIVIGNLLDNASLEQFFTVKKDAKIIVIHCAGLVTVSPDYDQKVYDVNVTGTQNIIRHCLEHKVAKLVYISSTGAIPECPKGQVIREVDSFNPEAVVGFYGKTKAEATQLVLDATRKNGLNASIVFPTGIFGPDDYAYGYVTNMIIDYTYGKIPAGVAGTFNAVDVRDLANSIIACVDKGRKGEGYIMSNSLLSMRDMYWLIHKYTDAPEVKRIFPIFVAKIIAFFAAVVSKITKKPALITNYMIYNLARNNEFSSEKAERELGYHARPFERTMADSVAWLKRENKLKSTERRPAALV